MARRRVPVTAAIGVLLLAAAACSAADDETPEASATGAPVTTGSAPTATGPGDPTETTAALPPGRTTGITDDAIKIGVLELNLQGVLGQTGAELALAQTRVGESYEVFADDVNAAGGVNGRRIELTTYPFNPIDQASMQSACIQATEEDGNFAVIAMGGLHTSAVLCLAETQDTLTIASGQIAEEDLARLDGKLFTIGMNEHRLYRGWIQALHDHGALGGKTLGIVHESTPEVKSAFERAAIPELERLGYEIAARVELPCSQDNRVCDQHENAVEVLKSAGVDGLLNGLQTLSNPTFIQTAVDAGYRPQYFMTPFNVATTLTELVAKDNAERREAYAGALSVSGDPNSVDIWPEFPLPRPPQPGDANKECNDRYDEVSGRGYPFDPEGGAENNDSRALIQGACQTLALLVHALTEAGPDLDDVKVSHALQQISDFEDVWEWNPVNDLAPEVDQGWGPGKFDGGNRLTLVEFNPDTLEWHPITDRYWFPDPSPAP
jgi:ABC-type branched-subunit amino acid transport system substrate-binding protein